MPSTSRLRQSPNTRMRVKNPPRTTASAVNGSCQNRPLHRRPHRRQPRGRQIRAHVADLLDIAVTLYIFSCSVGQSRRSWSTRHSPAYRAGQYVRCHRNSRFAQEIAHALGRRVERGERTQRGVRRMPVKTWSFPYPPTLFSQILLVGRARGTGIRSPARFPCMGLCQGGASTSDRSAHLFPA